MERYLKLGTVFLSVLLAFAIFDKNKPSEPLVQDYRETYTEFENSQPESFEISTKIPGHLAYDKVVEQLKTWEKESSEMSSVGTYGKSNRGKDLYFFRTGTEGKPKVLITACIHGNEPWATSAVMGYIGTLLSEYGRKDEVTELLDSRDIYFIPVVSPDSFPHSRHVDGVDPNRDFPTERNPDKKSIPPVECLKEFVLKEKFGAVWAGHTFGRVYGMPWGDRNERCPDDAIYQDIVGRMAKLSNYKLIRLCTMYNSPIYGTEADWYYKHGSFSVVVEYGTHQQIPSMEDTTSELDRTWKAFLLFCDEGAVALRKHQILYVQPLPLVLQ